MITPPASLTDTALVSTLHDSHEEMTRSKALFLLALAEFHARGLARAHGAPSTVIWLLRHCDVRESTAFEYLRVGTQLSGFTLAAQAFLAGHLSYSKIRVLLRHLTTGNEAELVALAGQMTLRELEQALAGQENSAPAPPADRFRVIVDDETGWVRFHGELNPVLGAELLAALKIAELANLRDLAEIDPAVLDDAERLDAALAEAENSPVEVEAVDETTGADLSATNFGVPTRNALLSALTGMIQMTRSRPMNKLRTPGAQVNLTVTEDGHAYLPSQPAAPASALVGAVLDGEIRAHLLNEKGVHITLGRGRRLVSDGQVRALMTRWHHQCAMPGCNHTRFLEFHHLHEWSAGGPTDLWNLVPLCSACHALVTVGRVRVEIDPTDTALVRFRFPGGHSFVSRNRGVPIRLGTHFAAAHRAAA